MLSLFGVTHCYSYSKIVLQLTVVPPGEYPINRVSNPEPTSYLSRYLENTDNIKSCTVSLLGNVACIMKVH
jgi:hypothetical protein